MKINKKGFTLIELLAVIFILGIVSVLATTLVVRYMSNARLDAFAVEASNVIAGAKNAVSMNELNKLEIENDNNSCKIGNRMCFTIDTLIELGVFKGNKDIYDGKVNIDISDKQNLKYKLYLEKKNEFNVVDSNVVDYSKNKEVINKGNFSGEEIEEYTICSCEEKINEIEYIDFIVTSSNREKIGYSDGENINLNIPATFQDTDGTWYKVVEIANSAFKGCTNIQTLTIPDTVTTIGQHAFYGCYIEGELVLPSSVTTCGTYAFNKNNFTRLVIHNTNAQFGIGECPNLETLIIMEGTTWIVSNGIFNNASLTNVYLPASLTYFGFNAFGAYKPTNIYYAGSEIKWNSISFDEGNSFSGVNIQYNVKYDENAGK